MVDEKRKPVLEDHTAVNRKLVPPFVHKLGKKLSQYSWARQLVPEAIWIGLLIDHCGYEAARKHCLTLSEATCAATGDAERPVFVKFSAFLDLSEMAKASMMSKLNGETLLAIRQSLAPLAATVPDHPLAFLGNAGATTEQMTRFPELLQEFYDRNGCIAVLSRAVGYQLGLNQGKIHVAPHLIDDLIERFKVIHRYPETDEANRAAGAFRAAESMLFMSTMLDDGKFADDPPWLDVFWSHISGFGACELVDTFDEESSDSDDPFDQFVIAYRNAVRADLRGRLAKLTFDLNAIEPFEVITALLCRQATLAMEMAISPGIWTPHIAPILLRVMADVFISLAWILRDPGPRARLFIEDGQGAIKLQIAHQKRALETTTDEDDAESLRHMIEMWSDWLKSQRMEAFVEVNLGSWSGLNARKMAEEAGFIDFYNYVYQPFSAAVHSNWAHVSMFNTVHCQNPAHRWHRGAAIAPIPPDLSWLHLASKYFSKTLGHFDEMQGVPQPHTAFELINARMFEMDKDIED